MKRHDYIASLFGSPVLPALFLVQAIVHLCA